MEITQLENYIENNQLNEIVALLTEKPNLATQTTSHQVSPMLLACYYKKMDIAKAISEFMPTLTIFDACAIGKFDEVTLLVFKDPKIINTYSTDGFTPLGLACHFNHEELARFLVMKGADVNLPSKNGFNVFPIHSATANNNHNIVRMLLDAGAYPNVCQKSGLAPLHSAAQLGNIELIIALLEHGADITLRMEGGKLPSDLAAEYGFLEISEILRDDD
jgi:ankyrin repeat protein